MFDMTWIETWVGVYIVHGELCIVIIIQKVRVHFYLKN